MVTRQEQHANIFVPSIDQFWRSAMKTLTVVSSLALSFALVAGAQAQTPRGDIDNTPFQGVYGQTDNSTSRAQVVAELQQARAAGLTGNYEPDNAPFTAQADTPSVPAATASNSNDPYAALNFGDYDNLPFQGV
jgi:hypothetical protein